MDKITKNTTTKQTEAGRLLLPHHSKMLAESAISEAVAQERGYRSVGLKSELQRLGFSNYQQRVPALLVPIYGVSGEIANYQIRPDEARMNRKGQAIKYETIAGSKICIDVPPHVVKEIRDPSKSLFITEGVKKADSAVSQGLCCIGLIGVWNWRGSNEWGGKTVLPDWDYIALKERKVYIVFDSDVVEKESVAMAMSRLKGFLSSRGADVSIIYLPAASDGRKVGLDDFFAAGHTVPDLMTFASKELRGVEKPEQDYDSPYRETGNGIVWMKPTREGVMESRLTNFTARIVSDVTEDDGAESRTVLEVEAVSGNRKRRFEIAASHFSAMRWPLEQLGTNAVVYPGCSDHARCAIQILSSDVVSQQVYAHTGWREIDGEFVYLHGGGAIGKDGLQSDVTVKLSRDLSSFMLPEPPEGEDLINAIQASLGILDAGSHSIMFPILAAIYRAPIGGCDFSLHLTGKTQLGKSELAALAQQHYGTNFSSRNLPASWSSTANALEAQAFTMKDAIVVIDDFVPRGSDTGRLHREADRIIRAQGNNSGRQRMWADGKLRPTKTPRGLIISTGEDTPTGQSLRARMLILEVGTETTIWKNLSIAQANAAKGLYAAAMSGYLQWLSQDYQARIDGVPNLINQLRERAEKNGRLKRAPQLVANLAV
jgi:hypothetical protein